MSKINLVYLHYKIKTIKTMLSFTGKLNRTKYWVANLLIMPALLIVAFFALTFAFAGVASTNWIVVVAGLLFGLVSSFMYLWMTLSVTIGRLRDAGQNPLFVLAIFIFPFLSLIIIGILPSEAKQQ